MTKWAPMALGLFCLGLIVRGPKQLWPHPVSPKQLWPHHVSPKQLWPHFSSLSCSNLNFFSKIIFVGDNLVTQRLGLVSD